MVEKPVKCIHCGTWNLPEAKFCRTCGDDLEPHRRLQEIEDELEMREKILQEWGVSDDDDQQLSQKPDKGGCTSVILLLISVTGLASLLI